MKINSNNGIVFSNNVPQTTVLAPKYGKTIIFMEPQIDYLITADNVILEEGTKKPTLVGVFDKVFIPKETNKIILPFVVFTRITNLTGEIKAEIVISDTKNNEVQRVPISGNLGDKKERIGLRSIVPFFEFNQIGKYKIDVYINSKKIKSDKENFIEAISAVEKE